jgi:hypothetical protein
MATVLKAKKSAVATKAISTKPPAPDNWQPIDPYFCEFETVSGEWLRGEAREENARIKMLGITYSEEGNQRQVRVPSDRVRPIETTETPVSENLVNDPALAEILQFPGPMTDA